MVSNSFEYSMIIGILFFLIVFHKLYFYGFIIITGSFLEYSGVNNLGYFNKWNIQKKSKEHWKEIKKICKNLRNLKESVGWLLHEDSILGAAIIKRAVLSGYSMHKYSRTGRGHSITIICNIDNTIYIYIYCYIYMYKIIQIYENTYYIHIYIYIFL